MTSWVLTIAKEYPNHWDIAKENGLWDMTKSRAIQRGDRVYFWVTGGRGLVGRVEVSDDARILGEDEALPWTDAGERSYVSRFDFRRAEDFTGHPVGWTDVAEATGWPGRPDWASRPTDDSAAEAWLSSLFSEVDPVANAFVNSAAAAATIADLGEDTRERAFAEIAVRRGQGPFRDALLSAYGRRCVVTGTSEEAVLEAAHIAPYRGEHTNLVANGLLLRSDIHTLFDMHRLTVRREEEQYVVRVSPAVGEHLYRELDGRPLSRMPRHAPHRPSHEALAAHNVACSWLPGSRRPVVDYVR